MKLGRVDCWLRSKRMRRSRWRFGLSSRRDLLKTAGGATNCRTRRNRANRYNETDIRRVGGGIADDRIRDRRVGEDDHRRLVPSAAVGARCPDPRQNSLDPKPACRVAPGWTPMLRVKGAGGNATNCRVSGRRDLQEGAGFFQVAVSGRLARGVDVQPESQADLR